MSAPGFPAGLSARSLLVTGAGGAIGRESALRMAREGASVASPTSVSRRRRRRCPCRWGGSTPLGDETEVFVPPHGKDADVQQLVDLRRMLKNVGFAP